MNIVVLDNVDTTLMHATSESSRSVLRLYRLTLYLSQTQ